MIIHSIIPMETIFAGFESMNEQFTEIDYMGIKMQVQMMNGNQAKIVRLFSPIASDYLNPKFAPGQIIGFHPDFS
ncbi:MAG: hypothetical protein A2189_08310 [Paenibacillus sp. RIFOXYA1_FULL_44_5]|nr:MAG: hypothetical protein A2189_08310 [Paenibacillus sp. RIFOXYA1_FULL_44_5]